jgi:hypothetical protein
VPYLLLTQPSNPRRLGDAGLISGFGGRSQIRIWGSLIRQTHPYTRYGSGDAEGIARFIEDILLHEMIHQEQQEVTGFTEAADHGHGPHFRDRCNAIGERLGLPPVKSRRERPACQHWPHNVRPKDYYRGAVMNAHNQMGPQFYDEIGAICRFIERRRDAWSDRDRIVMQRYFAKLALAFIPTSGEHDGEN